MEKRKITVAVLCMSTIVLSYMLIAPLLGEMTKSFPNATATQIQLVYTIPSMISVLSMLVAGKMVYYFSKKNMILISMGMVVVSGILPSVFHSSLIFLYFISAFMGIGLGVITTISSNIVSDHFKDFECARIMGYQSASISIGAAIMSALSGKIATTHWYYSYLVPLIFIPFIWIVFKFLPKDTPVKNGKESKNTLNARLLYFAFLSFLCGVVITGYNTNIALFIQDKRLGGVEIAGTVNSLCMLIGIPAGLIVGKLSKVFKEKIFFVAVASITCGFFVTSFSTNIIFIYLGAFLIGFGFAIRNPSAVTFAVDMVSRDSAAMAIAIVGAAANIGNFVSPFIINAIMNATGNSMGSIFITCGICSAVIAGLYLFTNPIKKIVEFSKMKNEESEF